MGGPLSFLAWQHSSGFEIFPFVFWLILPVIIWRKMLDKSYFSFKGIKKIDWMILFGVLALSFIVMFIIPHIESLKDYYMPPENFGTAKKIAFAKKIMIWNFSWLIGYEFLFRYVFFKKCLEQDKYYYLITLFEVLYHFNKPYPEMVGVFFLSIFLTYWTRLRRNFLIPLVAHFLIELSLLLFIVSV
jgi:membrane protease YdiL (CAAX protease family)